MIMMITVIIIIIIMLNYVNVEYGSEIQETSHPPISE